MMDPRRLEGVWFHSDEEDRGERVVYRGRSYEFPLRRAGRESMAFERDGTVRFGAPGPADTNVSNHGTWELTGNVVTLTRAGRHEVYEIESLEPDVMVLRRRERKEGTDGQ